MILLLGADSYVGHAFATALRVRKERFVPLAKDAFDYTLFEQLLGYVRNLNPDLIINATSCLEEIEASTRELDRMQILSTHVLLPQTIARVCGITRTPWGHVSSGDIFSGAKIWEKGQTKVEVDLERPALRRLYETEPDKFIGFNEKDEPNRSFKSPAYSFYSGTRVLGEEVTREQGNSYTWRLRLPFNEQQDPANFLSRLVEGYQVRDGLNSLSHLDECVQACLDLWQRRSAFGLYNVVNPGFIRTEEILAMIQRLIKLPPTNGPRQSNHANPGAALTLTSCILDDSKLRRAGVKLRPVQQVLEQALGKWQKASWRAQVALEKAVQDLQPNVDPCVPAPENSWHPNNRATR